LEIINVDTGDLSFPRNIISGRDTQRGNNSYIMDREQRSTRYRITPIEFWNTEVLLSWCGCKMWIEGN
jgi:hypothetical protein